MCCMVGGGCLLGWLWGLVGVFGFGCEFFLRLFVWFNSVVGLFCEFAFGLLVGSFAFLGVWRVDII